MTQNVPDKWLPYVNKFPLLSQAVEWTPLRQWSMSDVWRVTLRSGQTVIAKWGGDSMAGELEIYQSLLVPLNVPRPNLYAAYKDNKGNVLLMEDLGVITVESAPTIENFVNAARKLAQIRRLAQKQISSGELQPSVVKSHYKSQNQFIDDLHFVLGNGSLSIQESHTVHIALKELPVHLNRLYEEFPVTLTHNDYNAKNLMVFRNSIVPIDWSNAYLSPHLGDLYCLISEAQKYGIEKSVIVEAYREHDDTCHLDWQIQVGGICWLIRSLRWVCEEGIHKVPGTDEWVSPMIGAIHDCMEQLCE